MPYKTTQLTPVDIAFLKYSEECKEEVKAFHRLVNNQMTFTQHISRKSPMGSVVSFINKRRGMTREQAVLRLLQDLANWLLEMKVFTHESIFCINELGAYFGLGERFGHLLNNELLRDIPLPKGKANYLFFKPYPTKRDIDGFRKFNDIDTVDRIVTYPVIRGGRFIQSFENNRRTKSRTEASEARYFLENMARKSNLDIRWTTFRNEALCMPIDKWYAHTGLPVENINIGELKKELDVKSNVFIRTTMSRPSKYMVTRTWGKIPRFIAGIGEYA